MNKEGSFEDMMKTAAHIKEYQMNQDRQQFEKLPEFYKTGLYLWQTLNNVHCQSFYLKKCSYEIFRMQGIKQISHQLYEDASYTFCKALAIFKYIKSSNLNWKTDGGIKDWELEYIDDKGDSEQEKEEVTQMIISALLNMSLCELNCRNWEEVREACNEVIKLDPKNVKA